jgi:hypothetical protein
LQRAGKWRDLKASLIVFSEHAMRGQHSQQPVQRTGMGTRRRSEFCGVPWSLSHEVSDTKLGCDAECSREEGMPPDLKQEGSW